MFLIGIRVSRSSRAAIGFFIFGGIYAGLGAVALGFFAKSQINKGKGTGRKLALAGIWSGAIVSVLVILSLLAEPVPIYEETPRPGPAVLTSWDMIYRIGEDWGFW